MNKKNQIGKRLFGLIGYPLSHSFSQKYFTSKFEKENIPDCEYRNFSIERIQDFPEMLSQHKNLCGLNVTIPYKESIIPYLDEIADSAKEIGAVNCIQLENTQGKLYTRGYNTDIVGFEQSLKPLLKPHHTKALILGTGGASKAVAFVLNKLKLNFRFVSRRESDIALSYQNLNKELITTYTLVINTTPLGMFPNTNTCPNIPYQYLSDKNLLYDLTYNPEETLFLRKGKEKGAEIKNGLEMLHIQAEDAWKIWNSIVSKYF